MQYTTLTYNDKEYKLRLNIEESEALEDELSCNPLDLLTDFIVNGKTPKLSILSKIIKHSLVPYHRDIDANAFIDGLVDDGYNVNDFLKLSMEILRVSGYLKNSQEETKNVKRVRAKN